MRGRSYESPSPPPRRGRTRHNNSPRRRRRRSSPSPPTKGRYHRGGGGGRDLPTSLLVRNLRLDCRTEDLRRSFGEFGPLKDVYLPRDYYTGEPRGFGFVQFVDPDDAAEAKYHMDGETFLGRELTVVFAEENRKKPAEMRQKDRVRRSSSRYAPSYSRSPGHYSTSSRRSHYSRSISPGERRRYRERSYSRSPYYSRYRERSYSRSPSRGRSAYRGGRSYSRSPYRSPSPVRGRSVSSEDY